MGIIKFALKKTKIQNYIRPRCKKFQFLQNRLMKTRENDGFDYSKEETLIRLSVKKGDPENKKVPLG